MLIVHLFGLCVDHKHGVASNFKCLIFAHSFQTILICLTQPCKTKDAEGKATGSVFAALCLLSVTIVAILAVDAVFCTYITSRLQATLGQASNPSLHTLNLMRHCQSAAVPIVCI